MAQANVTRKARPLDVDALLAEMPGGRGAYDIFRDVLDAGALVRELRAAAGLTQAQLAATAGTTQSHVSEIEHGTGKQGPTVELLSRIGRACGDPISIMRHSRIEALKQEAAAASAERDELRRALAAKEAELETLRQQHEGERVKAKRRRAASR